MLILTRKPGEAIYTKDKNGNLIEVRVLNIQPGQVSLGINADRSTDIHREEVYLRLQAEEVA